MLTKTKNIRKKINKNFFSFKNSKKKTVRAYATTTILKEISALSSDIIATRTDYRRRTNCDFMSFADIVKHS